MKIKWKDKLGHPECPYVIRWVLETRWFSIRLHKWLGPDDLRSLHDHAWDYWAMVIKGGYVELVENVEGVRSLYEMWPWKPVFRKAERRHAVEPIVLPTWSILLTSSEKREWGFWVNGKFRKRNKYFFEKGHHPCD